MIDDFVRLGGTARGTAVNHFASNEEFPDAASKLPEGSLMRSTLAAIGQIEDPALRFARGALPVVLESRVPLSPE